MMKRRTLPTGFSPAAFRMNQAMNRERDNTMKQVIQKAKGIYYGQLPGSDLSVEKICRQLHMSSGLFFHHVQEGDRTGIYRLPDPGPPGQGGGSFNKTDDKTYVIAAKVGYQEQNYFSYVFKKRFKFRPPSSEGAK